jgi:trimeric autotransporter adhesin
MRAIQRAVVVAIAAIGLLAPAAAGASAPASASAAGTAGPAAGVISTVAGGVGGPAGGTKVALFLPCGVSFGAGHLYIADRVSVRQLSPGTGQLTTPVGTGVAGLLGDGGPAARASVAGCGVALDHSGNLVIADTENTRIRVVAHTTGAFYGRPMTAGHIYTVAGNGTAGFSGDGGPATSAELAFPQGFAVDAAGNLVIADTSNRRIRVVAHSTGAFYGQPMTAGDIYTVAGGGTGLGDGGPATSAALRAPEGVTVDAAGNLLIADDGRVRVVPASTGTFYGQPMTAGDIYTVAGNGTFGFSGDGGPATSAALSNPQGIAVDSAGNLVISDAENERIRVVAARTGTFYGQPMTAGDIYTVAGDGTSGFSGDGGPATSAGLNNPGGVAADAAGNLLIADSGNQRIRMVTG